MKELDTDYKDIPMSDITDEAREIAVRWGENMKDDFIAQKFKLASDIMNYAQRYAIKIAEKQRKADIEVIPTVFRGLEVLDIEKAILETPLVITRNTIPSA